MSRRRLLGVSLALLLILAQGASAQTLIQQSATHLDSCTAESSATSASNAVSTVTLTPPAGQYVYICSIYIVETINATVTGAAGPLPLFTSTNLQTNLVWWGDNSSTLAAGGLIKISDVKFGFPLKTAQPGVAFTIASSGTGQSTSNTRMGITGYFAP